MALEGKDGTYSLTYDKAVKSSLDPLRTFIVAPSG